MKLPASQTQALEALRGLSLRGLRLTEETWKESGNDLKIEGRPALFWVVEQAIAARGQEDHTRTRALAVLSWLLKMGLSTEGTHKGNTALMEAAGMGDLACARRLLSANANLAATSPMGSTPLHWAAIGGRPTMCKLLISHGASITPKNQDGRTPLHCAADRLRMNTIAVLHEAGSDWNVVDVQGRTPLETIAHRDPGLARNWKNRPERDRLAQETSEANQEPIDKPTRSRRL